MSPAAASLRAESPATSRAAVESLLRDRKLDRTLTTSRPLDTPGPAVPFQVQGLDAYLQGGLPAGQLSEVVGPVSSGRTTLVWQWMAAATRRGDTVALIDTFDRFDPASAVACGVDLDRLLWVRGQAISKTACAVDPVWLPGVRTVDGPGTMVERTLDRALKALNLVLQSGVCPVVVLDMGDVPMTALRRIPYTTWLRVQRVPWRRRAPLRRSPRRHTAAGRPRASRHGESTPSAPWRRPGCSPPDRAGCRCPTALPTCPGESAGSPASGPARPSDSRRSD